MESFNDECLRRFIEDRQENPHDVAAGLGYILASVVQRQCEERAARNKKIFWVTVNPKPTMKFTDLKYLIDKFMKRSSVKNGAYTFEIRGEERGVYHGYHAHMLFDKASNIAPSQIHRELSKLFKDNVIYKAIDVRVYNHGLRSDKIAYLEGTKWDDDKQESIEATRRWRKSQKLDDYYTT